MSLNWNWKDKCGTVRYEVDRGEGRKEFEFSLYNGNAYLIMIHETEDHYTLFSFWADKAHMNRMLGLDKKGGYDKNLYESPDERITTFRLNRSKCRNFKEIVEAVTQAFDNVTIEVFKEDDSEEGTES